MKKIVLIAVIAIAGSLFLPSCKKDYTCTCTYSDSNGQEQSVDITMNHVKKGDAKSACEGMNVNYSAYTGVQCKLK